ncbi:protein angel, putative [Perkinsus marinus ATCC 50983]|uniref:Protein angel, putative n=1 Tax=Perkinsus marinus (strain ATCC 50983 / TXsc) TaxID=423536 RepID=C5KH11_PERM5|nr:protein angel, putative [Perkinsus marinus ATCC 50983]EER15873.1 protein angel, putative [Perkinsus marinus ATCC 50983]|eukprot:XP_002784077.1 protein angel, putative [Perkinsus marinus ATCC 50983]
MTTTTIPPSSSVFSFLTWNVLHTAHYQRLLADPTFNNPKRRALAPSARQVNLTNHLLRLNADVVALQELDVNTLPTVKATLESKGGYRMVSAMINETVQAKDGCAIFCKADRFEPLVTTEFRMCHALDKYLHSLTQCQSGLGGALYRETREKLNLCVAALLRDRLTGCDLVAATTHLFWSPKFPDIKLLQAYLLSRQLEDFISDNTPGDPFVSPPAVILGGDFNSTPPNSAVYELLTKASVQPDHPEHPVSLRPGNRIVITALLPGSHEGSLVQWRLLVGVKNNVRDGTETSM